MPYSKSWFFLQAFLCLCLSLPAQRARYTEEYKNAYDIRVAGYLKNNLHAWSADVSSSRFQNSPVTLTLHVFSPDMRLLNEYSVKLGKIALWDIDFQFENNFYYANILYFYENRQSMLLLKVDPSGSVTDVSSDRAIWKRPMYPKSSHQSYAVAQKDSQLFTVLTQGILPGDSLATGEFIELPGEKTGSNEKMGKLVVRKINTITKEWIYQVFGSRLSRFYHPFIHVTDTAIFVAAITEQKQVFAAGAAPRGPLLFIARLDSNLTDSTTRMWMVKSTNGKKDETYSPFNFFPIKDKVVILSTGLYQRETYYFVPGNPANGLPPVPRVSRSYAINSLKITLLDENGHLLKDTIIEKKYGSMKWDNFFSTSSAKSVDLFCMRKYAGNKNGITRFSINVDGIIYEEDMIVDIKNEYNLSEAKETFPGVLVIPFTRKGRTGLVRLEFQPPE